MSKKKKPTANQKEWLQARSNLRRNITNMQKMGLYIPNAEELYNIDLPTRVTKKQIKQMKEFSSIGELGKQAYRMDYNTGEELNTYAQERADNARRRKKKKSEAELILQNAVAELEALPEQYITVSKKLKQQIDSFLSEVGKAKTAEELQKIANSDKFLEVFSEYRSNDYYSEEDTINIGTKNMVATMRALGVSEDFINNTISRMDIY